MPQAPPQAWAIVLAGGDGTRLRSVTTDRDGVPVPKQFCSLVGGPTLLTRTLRRARRLCGAERVVPVLTAAHARWWGPLLRDLPPGDRVVQPANLGTSPGILLPLLHVLDRDPAARVVLLPSDHFVGDEARFLEAMRAGLEHVARHPARVLLLGIRADHPETDYGWIVPGSDAAGAPSPVRAFVEKPPLVRARELMASGALWNSFVTIARGGALLALFARTMPGLLEDCLDARPGADGLRELYAGLEAADFSRQVLQACPEALDVLAAPACRWTDLGTPERVRACRTRRMVAG